MNTGKHVPERIIGQCSTIDFRAIEHLVNVYGTDAYDEATLKRKQQFALALVYGFTKVGLHIPDLYCIKEVIFWEHRMEFRFIHGKEHEKVKSVIADSKLSNILMNYIAEVLKKGGAHS